MPLPFIPEDLANFQEISQLDACDGIAACTVRSVDLEQNTYRSTIWTFSLDGSIARRFTTGLATDSDPHWSPDGRALAFISMRTGARQVHTMPRDGGEAIAITGIPSGVGSFQWTADGRSLIAICGMPIDPDSREEAKPAPSRPTDAPEVAWRVPYKSDGVGYLLGRAFHLFAIDASNGEARQLTQGAFDVLASCGSPDSREVAHVRTREGRYGHRTDLWVMGLDGSGARQLTQDFATVMSPSWSPDGKYIAFAGARKEGDVQVRTMLLELASGRLFRLGDDSIELTSPPVFAWREDSAALFTLIATHACQRVAELAVPDGAMTVRVCGERHVSELVLAPSAMVYLSESATRPRELFVAHRDGSGEHQLSMLNAWWDERTPLEAFLRDFEVPDGRGGRETIQGWLVRAKGSVSPQPLMMEAHGGPNSFALLGYPWNTYWNVLCSQGWTVVVPHCVGSTSFGREFAERLNGHWGELDFPQFMAVLDALQAEGVTDERVVIAGKSYGGYMSAWAIGHTDRFKAAIVAAPVSNLESHYGTSDGGYYSQPYTLSGERYIAAEKYRALSPVNYEHHAVTHTLILQGKEDERCPRGQSEELFAVLVRTDKAPSEMVLYPGGDHHLYETGKPSHRLDVVRRMVEWVTRHV